MGDRQYRMYVKVCVCKCVHSSVLLKRCFRLCLEDRCYFSSLLWHRRRRVRRRGSCSSRRRSVVFILPQTLFPLLSVPEKPLHMDLTIKIETFTNIKTYEHRPQEADFLHPLMLSAPPLHPPTPPLHPHTPPMLSPLLYVAPQMPMLPCNSCLTMCPTKCCHPMEGEEVRSRRRREEDLGGKEEGRVQNLDGRDRVMNINFLYFFFNPKNELLLPTWTSCFVLCLDY